jgi:hypothetical protein
MNLGLRFSLKARCDVIGGVFYSRSLRPSDAVSNRQFTLDRAAVPEASMVAEVLAPGAGIRDPVGVKKPNNCNDLFSRSLTFPLRRSEVQPPCNRPLAASTVRAKPLAADVRTL